MSAPPPMKPFQQKRNGTPSLVNTVDLSTPHRGLKPESATKLRSRAFEAKLYLGGHFSTELSSPSVL